jgi:REP element-mobilizing transposase RayT
MPHSHGQLLFHCVFSTRERRELLTAQVRESLYPYMASIMDQAKGHVLRVGGTKDHVHLLLRLATDTSVAEAMRLIKANSSRWLNRRFGAPGPFRWQEGFGAFTVSWSAMEDVCAYIDGQEAHHRRQSTRDELRRLLGLHGVEYDARFL